MSQQLDHFVLGLHVLGAIAWIILVVTLEVRGTRIRRTGSDQARVDWAVRAGQQSRLLALPGSLVVLLTGGVLMAERNVTIAESWWLGASIGCWIVAFLGSTMLRGPECKRIGRLADEHGAGDEDVQWRIRRVVLLGRGELLLLAVALTLMLWQPA
jgi:hypothetical protein